MPDNRMIMIADKETFLVRVLENKAESAGASSEYVPYSIDELNTKLGETDLVTLFIEDSESLKEDVLHFIIEKMTECALQMFLIGEDRDIRRMLGYIPEELIYMTFSRPVDNAKYVDAITGYYNKIKSGKFKKTILVVDDDPHYLGVVREWLKDEYRVFSVSSGIQAIRWIGKNKADLILLDHEMPVTNGPRVLEMLRSDEETSNIPVIFLTGKGDRESVMAVLALKPEGYFLKSIEKDELRAKLREFFESRELE